MRRMAAYDEAPVRRSPTLAACLSGLFPGLGQYYNGQKRKAALFAIATVLLGFGPFSPLDVQIDIGNIEAGLRKAIFMSVPVMAVALWSVVDAYRVAKATRKTPTFSGWSSG
jgi:hypothetical protein